jgi:hypothetical protein
MAEAAMRKPRVLNPPERIFLQVGELDADWEFDEAERSGEVTWCADPIYDTDVEYRLVKRRKRATPTVTGGE